jgi:hypothetical protein
MESDKSKYREKMLSIVEDWKQSGQNQNSYCKAHSIPYHRFHYWYKRYKIVHSTANDPLSSFIEVQFPSQQSHSYAEVIYPDGKRILFHQGVEVNFLKALIR